MQNETYNRRVLLYSGGMDSWLIDKIWKPDVRLFVDMGTASSRAERMRLPESVKIVEFQSLGQFERQSDFILPLRNLYLLAIASMYGNEICLGANATDANLDKTPEFAQRASELLTYMYGPQKWTDARNIRVDVSFRAYTKGDLLRLYLEGGGDWETAYRETFSCFTPNDGRECHCCRACFLKMAAFFDAGIYLPAEIMKTYLPYIRAKVDAPEYIDRLYSKEWYKSLLRKYDTR